MKKSTQKSIFVIFSIVLLGSGLAWWSLSTTQSDKQPCAFCDPIILQTHTFYQDDYVRCMCTHKPIQPGHCLIVPKRHIERFEEASEEEIIAMGQAIKKINRAIQQVNGPSSYLILQKNGPEVGQTVPHVHVHYIPKKVTNNKLTLFGLLWDFVIAPFQRPLKQEQLALCVTTMQQALADQIL